METPTAANPWAPYILWNSENQGISFLHPVHHVAQKSSRTTLPRYFFSFTVLPELSFSANSGAAFRAVAGGSAARPAGWSAAAAAPPTTPRRTEAAATVPRRRGW